MSNELTTAASVASRLTDEELKWLAAVAESGIELKGTRPNTAAVLRDYVRLRKLANAVKALTYDDCPWWADGGDCAGCPSRLGARCPFGNQKRLLAEAEKGETK